MALHLHQHDDASASCASGHIVFQNSTAPIHADVSYVCSQKVQSSERNKKNVSMFRLIEAAWTLIQYSSEEKIFEYFSMYFYGLNLGWPSWTLGPSFEQTW